MVFKINSRNKERYLITTLLFNRDLALRKRTAFYLDMQEQDDFVDKFNIDNDGDSFTYSLAGVGNPNGATATSAYTTSGGIVKLSGDGSFTYIPTESASTPEALKERQQIR